MNRKPCSRYRPTARWATQSLTDVTCSCRRSSTERAASLTSHNGASDLFRRATHVGLCHVVIQPVAKLLNISGRRARRCSLAAKWPDRRRNATALVDRTDLYSDHLLRRRYRAPVVSRALSSPPQRQTLIPATNTAYYLVLPAAPCLKNLDKNRYMTSRNSVHTRTLCSVISSVSETTRKPPLVKAQTALRKRKK